MIPCLSMNAIFESGKLGNQRKLRLAVRQGRDPFSAFGNELLETRMNFVFYGDSDFERRRPRNCYRLKASGQLRQTVQADVSASPKRHVS
jgi:hypothetical protein